MQCLRCSKCFKMWCKCYGVLGGCKGIARLSLRRSNCFKVLWCSCYGVLGDCKGITSSCYRVYSEFARELLFSH